MDNVVILNSWSDNYIYVVQSGTEALVIDPSEAIPVLDHLKQNNLSLKMILNTHHHFDHVGGNHLLKEKTGATVLGCDQSRIPECDRSLERDEVIAFGEWTITVCATPGHTPDSISFVFQNQHDNQKYVFSGDTLFRGGCGRILGTNAMTLWNSLNRLAELPDETLIFPGHDYTLENYEFAHSVDKNNKKYVDLLNELRSRQQKGLSLVPSTIKDEKETNIFLQAASKRLREVLAMPHATDTEIFAQLRIMKNSF